jgi:RNA polymerase sigma factor (sigma-70 family)
MVQFDRQTWFAQQILVHEARLRSYLRRFLKAHCDVADGIQETYARLLSLPDGALVGIRHPDAFLFAAARNVALEWVRRERMIFRDPMAESGAASVLDERPSAYEQLSTRQELNLLARAVASLPERCRQVLTLRKLYGLSQKEIAARLGISENTVEKHTANGVRLCADYLYAFQTDADPRGRRARQRSSVPASDGKQARHRGECMDSETRRARANGQAARAIRTVAVVEPEV